MNATGLAPESPTRPFLNATDEAADLSNKPSSRRGGLALRGNSLGAPVLGILLVTALGIGSYWFFGRDSIKQIDSIAVMPFVNESGNSELEYLSDGMTESLINSLSQLPNLNVKARSSVFRYKGKETDAQVIGKELGVQAILNGHVVQRGDASDAISRTRQCTDR